MTSKRDEINRELKVWGAAFPRNSLTFQWLSDCGGKVPCPNFLLRDTRVKRTGKRTSEANRMKLPYQGLPSSPPIFGGTGRVIDLGVPWKISGTKG